MLEGWSEYRIDELGTDSRPALKAGPFGSSVTKSTYQTSGYKVYGQQEVVAKSINAESYFVSDATFQRHKSCAVKSGDILMTMMGTIGRVFLVPDSAPVGIINPRLVRISFDRTRIDPEFAEIALEQNWLQRLLERRSHGGTMPGLNLEAIASIKLRVPPLPEQRKIAQILCSWDNAIKKAARLIEVRQRQHLALTHQLVFGQRRLGNFAASGDRTEHRWFDLPSDWQAEPIGKLSKEISKKNGGGTAAEVLSCTKYVGFVRSLEYFKKQVFSGDLSGYKKIWHGDFGFPSNHVEEGSIGLQELVDIGLVSPIYTIFRFDPEKIDNAYAFAVLKTSLYRHIFEVSTSSSVDRRGSLRWKEFSKIPFPVPSLAEQRAISGVLAENRGLIERLKAERDALQRQKRGLMQKLLTGEWRVTTGQMEAQKSGVAHG